MLRREINRQKADGLILPRTDEFQSEFLAPCSGRLEWLTGFTGSAGAAVILADRAVVLSDSRYTIQLRQQVDGALYETADSMETPPGIWLARQGIRDLTIGYDPWLHTPRQLEKIREDLSGISIRLQAMEANPVDAVWAGRPAFPDAPVSLFPDEIAGRSAAEKRERIALDVRGAGAQACVLTAGDSICWLLNVRGADVEFSPLVLSYALLHGDGSVDWFVDETKVSGAVRKKLGAAVRVVPPEGLRGALAAMQGQKVWLDRRSAPAAIEDILLAHGAEVLDRKDPCVLPKALKTREEQAAIRQAHIHDGVAVVRFLKWLDEHEAPGDLTEIGVAEKLEDFRKGAPCYKGPSFGTIAGAGPNGAIVHYRASAETDRVLDRDSLLLIDSGGQYEGGTTDITRTVAIGAPTQEMRENYTRVLRGHIAVAKARFPEGTRGVQIDALARAPLWAAGLDYGHGTGHGVGCYLCVHEEAASISPRGEEPFQAGMLISNEPGYYKEGAYGIRIENLVLVREEGKILHDGRAMLGVETVTLAPFDPRLIVSEMLTEEETLWLRAYSEQIRMTLDPFLDADERIWLARQTSAI